MRVIILCGGLGTRLDDYSLPKPLNMINGSPSIKYCLQNIPDEIDTLHFVVGPHLSRYNFEETVTNLFKNKKCIFHSIHYTTRGPVETAWLGTSELADSDESVVFLDNDIVYNFPSNFFENKDTPFLGYGKDSSSTEAYSFLTVDNAYVTNFKEKKRISDNFCCGVYGFSNIKQFRDLAFSVLNSDIKSELYMSTLFIDLLAKNIPVSGFLFENVYHIGSLKELNDSWDKIKKPSMRVCFDLDNTLVTYPTIPGDYTTVKPIKRMIDLAKKMKAEGHTIIIHTARRMRTHGGNIGSVIKDIGLITFQNLSDFDIPYDEILFGKPIADIYIDDRAVNPYISSIESMGYLYPEDKLPLNMLSTNKYNNIRLIGDKIHKSGPTAFIRGEIYFYEHIPHDSAVIDYFPKFYGSIKGDAVSQMYIENITGIPFYTLFKKELINEKHILGLFDFLDILHNLPTPSLSIINKDMYANYYDKLKARFENSHDYPFPDAAEIQTKCLESLVGYVPSGVSFIHGDLWFSNIIIDFNGNLKMIDMKGQVNSVLTTGGDKLYDYGKLYQSFLGYDAILYGDSLNAEYRQKMTSIFLREVEKRHVCIADLIKITRSLVIGTLHFIDCSERKSRVWDFVKTIN